MILCCYVLCPKKSIICEVTLFLLNSGLDLITAGKLIYKKMSLILESLDAPTRQLKFFWSSSGDFWQTLWERILDIAGKVKHV